MHLVMAAAGRAVEAVAASFRQLCARDEGARREGEGRWERGGVGTHADGARGGGGRAEELHKVAPAGGEGVWR